MENNKLLQAIEAMMDRKLEPLQSDMGAMKADMGAMKADMGAMKADMGAIHQRLDTLETKVTKTNITLENDVSKKLSLLFEGQRGMNDKFHQLDALTEKVADIQTTVEVLKALQVKR